MVSLSVPAALAALSSSRRGLSEPEAGRRRAAAGPNSLPRARRRPVWAELAAQLANMFAVVLLLAAGLTFLIYFLSVPRDAANLVLAFGILGVVVLNALIGFAQEHAAERTAEALQAMVPPRARVLRAGQLDEIPAEDLVPGDVVSLEAGDAVSADARLIEVHALSIEMAALTGESQPVGRTSEPARERESRAGPAGPLPPLPSGDLGANAAWVVLAAITQNILRAAGALASMFHAKARCATLRRDLINVPASTARTGRATLILRGIAGWYAADACLNLHAATRPGARGPTTAAA